MNWETGLVNVINDYFVSLFASSNTYFDDVIDCVPTTIIKAHNIELLRHITSDEIYKALFQMQPDKSPSLDGLNSAFY